MPSTFIFRKDDDWKLSRGVFVFVIIGLLLLLGAISAVTVIIIPWTVSGLAITCVMSAFQVQNTFLICFCLLLQQIGAAFLLVLLLIVLAIGVIHYWASNNFYLTRTQMFFVCFLAFLLALAAFLVGWFQGEKSLFSVLTRLIHIQERRKD